VGAFDRPGCHDEIQIMRNCAEGNRFISGRLVNFPDFGRGRTNGYLRLRIGTRKLQTRYCELTLYFLEKPRAGGKTADQKDGLSQSR